MKKQLTEISLTQRFACFALVFLSTIIVCQLLNNQHLAERFAVLLYYALCLSTLSALTEHHHTTVKIRVQKSITQLQRYNTDKQYRWTYLCYFIFVLTIIRKYGYTDEVTFVSLIFGWLLIYFPGYYFFILSILYTLIMHYLGLVHTTDIYYGISYFVCGVIASIITPPKSFK